MKRWPKIERSTGVVPAVALLNMLSGHLRHLDFYRLDEGRERWTTSKLWGLTCSIVLSNEYSRKLWDSESREERRRASAGVREDVRDRKVNLMDSRFLSTYLSEISSIVCKTSNKGGIFLLVDALTLPIHNKTARFHAS